MEPEGSKNAESQTEDRGSHTSEGNMTAASRAPVYTAVPTLMGGSRNVAENEATGTDTAQVPELIPAVIYAKKIDEAESPTLIPGRNVPIGGSASDKGWLQSSLYNYSLICGLLVGCFIQSSSLGANYILMIVFGRDLSELAKHQNNVVVFSLAWSFITSMMGITILLILRSLVSLAINGLNMNNIAAGRPTILIKPRLSLAAFVELPFAFGALAGVCGAWSATDLLLGLNSHAYNSLLTMVLSYLGKIVFESCSNQTSLSGDNEEEEAGTEEVDEWSEQQRLLPSAIVYPSEMNAEKIHSDFKVKGLFSGLLVGFFIQLSSLGASFLIDALVNSRDPSVAVVLSKGSLVAFSLGWSFVFGTMGVTILLLLRYLIGIVCDHIISESKCSYSETEKNDDMADRWSLSLEFFFAVGCLVGVNVAWLITDVGLGLNAHIWRSFATLAAAGFWCFVLACCFGFRKALHDAKSTRGKMVTKATQTTDSGMLIV